MYYYLYDSFLSDRKYEKVLDRIKTRLLDLGIQGKHERMSLLKSIEALITDEAKRGAKTVVVVGNDKTFLKAVDSAVKAGVTLSIIPIGDNNSIAKGLGIPEAEKACEVLSARKIAQFDLGQVENNYFFANLKIDKNLDRISVSHQGYKIIPKKKCSEISILNLNFLETADSKMLNNVNPQDKMLSLVIKSKLPNKGISGLFKKNKNYLVDSIIQGNTFEVKSFEYLPILLDEYRVIKTPVSVKLADKRLKVIIGRSKNIRIN